MAAAAKRKIFFIVLVYLVCYVILIVRVDDLFCNPYQAAQKGYIEDIIEPRNTRFRVIRALEALSGKQQDVPAKKHDNLPL